MSWDAAALAHARIDIFDTLDACEDIWRRAMQDCACTVFQTYDWLAAWRDALAGPGGVSYAIVHVAGPDDATLLLLPLGVFRRFGARCLEFLGGDLCDYNAPLIDRALARQMSVRDAERLWRVLFTKLPPIDVVNLRRMPRQVDGVPNPFVTTGCRPGGASFAASLPQSFDAFVGSRSRSFFSQNRRHRRRLEKEGAVTLAFPHDPRERLALARFILEKKALWQRRLGLPCTFGSRGHRDFYERLTRSDLPSIEVVTAGLLVDGTIVAGLWGVIFREKFLFLITSYHPDWAAFRVGRLVMEAVVRFCIERRLEVFDLTTGDEPYKANWADSTTPVFDDLSARTLLGRVMLRCRTAKPYLARIAAFGPSPVLHRLGLGKARRNSPDVGGVIDHG